MMNYARSQSGQYWIRTDTFILKRMLFFLVERSREIILHLEISTDTNYAIEHAHVNLFLQYLHNPTLPLYINVLNAYVHLRGRI
jgi:hypothetical protein